MEKLKPNTRRRPSSTIPFGYHVHPKNPHLIVENPLEQSALIRARSLADKVSLRGIAAMIEGMTGRKLTPRGTQKLLRRAY